MKYKHYDFHTYFYLHSPFFIPSVPNLSLYFSSVWTSDRARWHCAPHAAVQLPPLRDGAIRRVVLHGQPGGPLLRGGGCMGSGRRGEGESSVYLWRLGSILLSVFSCVYSCQFCTMCKLIHILFLIPQVFELPENVGIPFGGANSKTFYRLEIHYNNINNEKGKYCSSFFTLSIYISYSWIVILQSTHIILVTD